MMIVIYVPTRTGACVRACMLVCVRERVRALHPIVCHMCACYRI